MGAHALSALAGDGESALRAGREAEAKALVASLAAELHSVCAALRRLARTEAAPPVVAVAATASYSPELVASLERALDDADPVEARACLDALYAVVGKDYQEKLDALMRAIGDFDFALAQSLLGEIVVWTKSCRLNVPRQSAPAARS